MRTKFWQKKDIQLDQRLNTVLETAERLRKSIGLSQARATARTSYLDMAAAVERGDETASTGAGGKLQDQDRYPSGKDCIAESLAPDDASQLLPGDDRDPGTENSAGPAEHSIAALKQPSDALSQMAAEEASAVKQPQTASHQHIDEAVQELAALRAEAQQHANAAREAHAALELETMARMAAEAARDDVLRKLESTEAELQLLRSFEAAREAETRKVIAAVAREAEGRRAAEAERDKTNAGLQAGAAELMHLRSMVAARDCALNDAEAAVKREIGARRSLETDLETALRKVATAENEVASLMKAALEQERETTATDAAIDQPAAQKTRTPDAPRYDVSVTTPRGLSRFSRQGTSGPEIAAAQGTPTAIAPDVALKAAETVTTGSPEGRRDRRLTSQMPATLWREGMGQPLACTLKDRSSSGARLEFKHTSMIEGVSAFNTGDQVTLTLNSAHEKTWVGCEVVWVNDNRCGVRFSGQFRSEGPASRKSLRSAAPEKAPRAKTGSRFGAVFSTRGS
ncbi:MAG: PilZ domain-containing protein [Hyphomicrobiaceae bacterium]